MSLSGKLYKNQVKYIKIFLLLFYLVHQRELNPENVTELEIFLRDLINFEHNGLWNLASHPDIKESDYPQILDQLSKQFPYNATFSSGLNLPFTRILTELGVCHTFNSMIAYYISPQ